MIHLQARRGNSAIRKTAAAPRRPAKDALVPPCRPESPHHASSQTIDAAPEQLVIADFSALSIFNRTEDDQSAGTRPPTVLTSPQDDESATRLRREYLESKARAR